MIKVKVDKPKAIPINVKGNPLPISINLKVNPTTTNTVEHANKRLVHLNFLWELLFARLAKTKAINPAASPTNPSMYPKLNSSNLKIRPEKIKTEAKANVTLINFLFVFIISTF